jgi:putative nucleotidyltransferase with HDIG domain
VATLASALARAVDAKDAYTHSHCETVAELCAMIATELGLAPERVAQVRLAGLLHDVGKIGISDAILQKPGPLTDEEFRVMRTHPSLGSHIVSAAELYQEAGWIHHHHERVDGRGYPDGLGGKSIPLESRIIMVADAFEAITADRPYRDRRSVSEALVELNRHAGTQFDITCLRALERIITGGAVVIRPVEAIRLVA